MTESLLQKLEEKMMAVLSEMEQSRKEIQRLQQENSALKFERDNNMQKLQGLVSLLDTMNLIETPLQNTTMAKPVLVQVEG